MSHTIARGTYYTVRAAPADDPPGAAPAVDTRATAEVFIYGLIGDNLFEDGVEAAELVAALAALTADRITVRINSNGGSVPDAIALYNALRGHAAGIDVQIDGWALSAASLIAMAGDTVAMPKNTLMMIHAPAAMAAGNAAQLREHAAMLDQWAAAMQTAYVRVAGSDRADAIQALLTDGRDHWYTADQALAAGVITRVIDHAPVTAAADFRLGHVQHIPAAAAAFIRQSKEQSMPDSKPASRGPERHPNGDNAHPDTRHTSADVTAAAHQAVAELRQAETQRRHDIRATFKPYARYRGVAALEADCLDDMDVAVDAARKRLLDKIGEGVEPLAGASVAFGADETEKRRDAKVEALLARVGASDEAGRRITAANNPYRGQKLADMAKASLAEIGVDVAGQNPEEYAPKALSRVTAAGGQTGSDFAVVLENTLHKLVVSSWDATPIYWNRFCREGSVSDFREHRRLVPGLMGGFAKKNEAGEYTIKNIPDAEKQSIAAEEHGNIIIVDRQALVNDDMGYIAQQAADIGMAGARGVDADVFRLLATNPKLRDGNALFSAAHGNLIATGTAPSVDALVAAADKLMEQKAPGDDGEYLDLAPMVSVARHTTTHDIAGVVNSEYDPESQATRAYNKARGLVQSFVGTPKITGTEWYFFADPQIAPVLEVVFLNGQNQPRLIQQEDFNTGSLKWRPTLDYNVGAIGHRGAVKNPGG